MRWTLNSVQRTPEQNTRTKRRFSKCRTTYIANPASSRWKISTLICSMSSDSCQDFGVDSRSLRGRFSDHSESIWGQPGSIQGRFEIYLGSFRGPSGVDSRWSWCPYGVAVWDLFGVDADDRFRIGSGQFWVNPGLFRTASFCVHFVFGPSFSGSYWAAPLNSCLHLTFECETWNGPANWICICLKCLFKLVLISG